MFLNKYRYFSEVIFLFILPIRFAGSYFGKRELTAAFKRKKYFFARRVVLCYTIRKNKAGGIRRMKCPNCGGDSKGPFCDYCGTELNKKEPKAKKRQAVAPGQQHIGRVVALIIVPLFLFSGLWVWSLVSNSTEPLKEIVKSHAVIVQKGTTQTVKEQAVTTATAKTTVPPGPGSREKPIRKGDTAVFNGMDTLFDQYRLELTVTDVKRGQEAWALAVAGNRFNKKPEAGKEYLLVTYKIKVLDSADGKAVSLNNALFKFVSQKGVKYNDFVSLAGLKPALTDLYKGGEAEGIVYGMVDEGDQPLVVFLERNDGGIWFSVE